MQAKQVQGVLCIEIKNHQKTCCQLHLALTLVVLMRCECFLYDSVLQV